MLFSTSSFTAVQRFSTTCPEHIWCTDLRSSGTITLAGCTLYRKRKPETENISLPTNQTPKDEYYMQFSCMYTWRWHWKATPKWNPLRCKKAARFIWSMLSVSRLDLCVGTSHRLWTFYWAKKLCLSNIPSCFLVTTGLPIMVLSRSTWRFIIIRRLFLLGVLQQEGVQFPGRSN